MTDVHPPLVGVCVPTIGRPGPLRTVLESLGAQQRPPDLVVVVDAGDPEGTESVLTQAAPLFGPQTLRHVVSPRGLPQQRIHGIEYLRAEGAFDYVCMLDDDVILPPDFLDLLVAFMQSTDGQGYGGTSGYDVTNWGRPFERLERLYHSVGIYDGEFLPGRWLYCGSFLEHSRLMPFSGVHRTDFLPGGLTLWRMEVFDHLLPPRDVPGYALGEDKHFSLRVGTRYSLGIVGAARVRHERAQGGRHGKIAMAYRRLRSRALMLRDCDPDPRLRRYLAFLGFNLVHLLVSFTTQLLTGRIAELPKIVGAAAGWLMSLVCPPRRTVDALRRAR